MTPEEQRIFDAYVEHRRSLYPWWLFTLVLSSAGFAGIGFLIIVFSLLWS